MSFDFVRLFLVAASLQLFGTELPDRIIPSSRHLHTKTGLEVVSGELTLPRAFLRGYLRPAPGEKGLVLPQLVPADKVDPADGRESISFQVLALRRGHSPEARLELVDSQGLKAADLRFVMPTKVGDEKPLHQWLEWRIRNWEMGGDTLSPLQMPLRRAAAAAYGKDGHRPVDLMQRNWRRNREGGPSPLAILGGRAAVDETLQLDRTLALGTGPEKPEPGVPFSAIPGIDTPPHPWADMRAGAPIPAPMALALCVPQDRALLYLPKPKAALASLEGAGAAFLQRVSSFTGNGGLDTSIVSRMLEDLGLGHGRGRRLIESGAVSEAVLFFPDLAFLAGTEATVVADLARPEEGSFIPEGSIHSFKTGGGRAFAARRGRRIFLSTSKAELESALALHLSGGKDSLGGSDEFAVVLGKLAPTPDTELFLYLPDAFIRALVGPRLRILQARQSAARTAMEDLAAAALLRRMDAPGAAPTIEDLKSRGYLHEGLDLRHLSLTSTGQVRHAVFGPLERLQPLARVPITEATAEEAAAYHAFRDSYKRYWSRYFDPIAVRLEAHADGWQTLETFVLPLLESSLYQSLKELLVHDEPLPQPRWRQPMVAELGLRMGLGKGRVLPRSFSDFEALMAQDCTGVVVAAFPDGAPIIATGNGSPATILQADPFNQRDGVLGLGAMALGLFTRPVVVAFELKDPESTRRNLREQILNLLPPSLRNSRELDSLVTIEPEGGLMLRLGFLGLASMRFTARVEDRWLVVTNDASLPRGIVVGTGPGAPFAARLSLHPEALDRGLSAAFQAAVEGESRSAFAAMAWLAPWLQTSRDVKAAQAESHRILGAAPLLDADALLPGRWLEHKRYGLPWRTTLPAFDPKQDFGLLEGVREPTVEMRMEGTGLRARVGWRK